MTIDCAFYSFCAADADARTSKAGKPWVRLRVGVGRDDNLQWVQVNVFGPAAATAVTLKRATRSIARAPSSLTPGAAMTASNATRWPWPHSNASAHTKSAAPKKKHTSDPARDDEHDSNNNMPFGA